MKTWKPVEQVWKGGTAELQQFKGARVRLTRACQFPTYHGEEQPASETAMPLAAGRIGLLANARMDAVFVGFPVQAATPVTTLEALSRQGSNLAAFKLNWPTFKAWFEIEVG